MFQRILKSVQRNSTKENQSPRSHDGINGEKKVASGMAGSAHSSDKGRDSSPRVPTDDSSGSHGKKSQVHKLRSRAWLLLLASEVLLGLLVMIGFLSSTYLFCFGRHNEDLAKPYKNGKLHWLTW